jgi:hypothetical protein
MKNILFQGETVEYNFFPGELPVASEGKFHIRNDSSKAVNVEIKKVLFVEGGVEEIIEDFFMYHMDDDLDNPFSLEHNAQISFRITFAFREVLPSQNISYQIKIIAEIDDTSYEAFSDLDFTIEKGVN